MELKPIGAAAMLIEFFGSFALLVGFLTRPCSRFGHFMAMAIKGSLGTWVFLARRPGEGSGSSTAWRFF
jgi:uncharacterized membrane protein YphA (DoxX/SURF4 family)